MRDTFSQAGIGIRSKYNPSRIGTTLGEVDEEDGVILVKVRFEGEAQRWVPVEQLELLDTPLDEETIIAEGRFSPATLLRRVLTSFQLAGDLSEMIYSMDVTNTEFMPHQFKPLLALLDSPSRGVLIADEVGLGKTIEAGLIWTELRARANANTMLVVCPAMLTEKWKLELANRFGTRSTIMSSEELLEWIAIPHQRVNQAAAIICSMQGLRPPRGWADAEDARPRSAAQLARKLEDLRDNPIFDLTVIDEAHYLRNESTSTAELGRLLRPVSEHFVLLSATPVNTRSGDLFNLVSLIDPQQFQFPKQFEDVLEANRPLVIAANCLKRPDCTAGEVLSLLAEAGEQWLLADSKGLKALRKSLEELPSGEVLFAAQRVDISERLQRVNLLGQTVIRSRKREVLQNRVVRRPRYYQARMTPSEQALYKAVTEAIVEYATSHDGVEGFLLAMPQQQMSSCMYAAAKRWKASDLGNEFDDELAFDALGELSASGLHPVRQHVEAAVRGRIDLDALRAEDSKFTKLTEILREQEKETPGEKLLIFSFFRDTLAYLKLRLESSGYPCTIVQGGDDKQAAIDGFRENSRQRILLATEVAAEGVDLQFMRLLINYDLPWNPMRIEQRIGRIDRIGQSASAITIFNLVYEDTIDARILMRLFNRLKIFQESLGSIEEVIGSAIGELTQQLLSAGLTESEQNEAIDQTRYAIEQRQRDLAVVEQSEADFLGLGDYVRDRVIRAHQLGRSISDDDLRVHLLDYLDAEASGYTLQLQPGTPIAGELKLPAAVAARLKAYREDKKLPRSVLESGYAQRIVIRNHVDAGKKGSVELINQFHPLVRLIADSRPDRLDSILYALEVASSDLRVRARPGKYAFSAEAWRFAGIRNENTIRASFISLDDGTQMPEEDAFDVLNAMRANGRSWIAAPDELPNAALVVKYMDTARRQLARARSKEFSRRQIENADRARIQTQGVIRNRDHRIEQIERAISGHVAAGRTNLINADRVRQRNAQEQAEVLLEGIKARAEMTSKEDQVAAGVLKISS